MLRSLVHLFTFFMVAPIFNSMMRIDRRLIEAAYDAGATGWQTLWNVVIPLAKPGIVIGSIFVITIVMGDYITIGVMGGQQIAAAGKIIEVRLNALQFPARRRTPSSCSPSLHHHRGALAPRRHPQGALNDGRAASLAFLRPGGDLCGLRSILYGPMIAIYVLSFQGPKAG